MKQAKINECLQLVRMSNRKVNEIRFGENESVAHKEEKIRLCEDLLRNGHSFVTEAIFVTGGRADILVLDLFTVIEILVSENDSNLIHKKNAYPEGLIFKAVRV